MKEKEHAIEFLQREWHALHDAEKRVIEKIIKKRLVARDVNSELSERVTFGERVADAVAKFGGSWTFIIIFLSFMMVWVVLNSFVLYYKNDAFDPYPYILLNLFLSMTAAFQAPIIMMSQNRLAARDRLAATSDYEVNLKAEMDILDLHVKIDELRETKWLELINLQHTQIKLLEQLLEAKS